MSATAWALAAGLVAMLVTATFYYAKSEALEMILRALLSDEEEEDSTTSS